MKPMRNVGFRVCWAVAVILWVLPTWDGIAGDWPQWRGPKQDGISDEADWSARWPQTGPAVAWEARVGTGFSSVSVSEGRLFTSGNLADRDTIYCLDTLNGNEIWKYSYACKLDPNLYEGGPGATPTVDGTHVFTLSKEGHLFCFRSATGELVWQKNLVADCGVKKPTWGFASSPVVYRNMIVLNAGGQGAAFDKTNGKLVWLPDKSESAYATPVLIQSSLGDAFILLGHRELFMVKAEDGKLIWRLPWKCQYDMNVPDPILWRDRIFASSWDQPGTLLELKEGHPEVVWQSKEMRQHINAAVVVDDHLYGFHGDANNGKEFKCLDLRDGTVKWVQKDLHNGSVMVAGGRLILLTGKGVLMVAKPSPVEFYPLARAQVFEGKCWTVPVMAHGRIYCRSAAGLLKCLNVTVQP
jgi:outer membrane protein assembly factor BamB